VLNDLENFVRFGYENAKVGNSFLLETQFDEERIARCDANSVREKVIKEALIENRGSYLETVPHKLPPSARAFEDGPKNLKLRCLIQDSRGCCVIAVASRGYKNILVSKLNGRFTALIMTNSEGSDFRILRDRLESARDSCPEGRTAL
jgi:hypothetical protein